MAVSRFIDVSHDVEHEMITYAGIPGPIICDYLSREDSRDRYAPGTEFNIGKIEMVANTGTYVDSPFHRYPDGKDLSELPLTSLANLECLVASIPQTNERAIDRLPFSESDVRGRAILVHTGWDRHWRSDQYFEGHPYLTGALASWLVAAGAVLVGIDSYNIDSTDTGERASGDRLEQVEAVANGAQADRHHAGGVVDHLGDKVGGILV